MRTSNVILPMHHEFVSDAYKKIVEERRSNFGEYHKCVFHLHSPASYDYVLIDRLKDQPGKCRSMKANAIMQIAYDRDLFPKDETISINSIPFPDSLYENSVEYISYLLIAHELVRNEIELVILTDHNTIKGYEKLTHAICTYTKSKHCNVYPEVVLGIEISCADRNHIVGIFDHKRESLLSELNQWIDEHIMSDKDGTYETSVSVLEFIESIGGVGYIAHIDSSDIFKGEQFSAAFKKKLFNNPSLHAIGLHNMTNRESTQGRIQEIADREFDYILDCDSHSLDTINTNYMWIKGTKRNFKMIRQAILDYSFSIQMEKPQRPETFIQGIALKGGSSGFLSGKNGDDLQIRFSEALNCIIGGRGTGKSTILNMLGFLLGNRVETEEILEIICTHPFIWIFVHHKETEYVVCFQVPKKEYSDQPTFKALSQASRFDSFKRTSYSYDEKSALDFSKKFIDVFAIQQPDTNESIVYIPVKNKQDILKRISATYYTVNGLVNVASDGRISNFISSIIMDNIKLSSIPRFVNYQYKSLANWVKKAEESVSKRRIEIDEILGLFNNTQQGKLRIVRCKNSNPISRELIEEMIQGQTRYYRGFNILRSSVVDYVEEVLFRYGFEEVIEMFNNRAYTTLLYSMPIRDYAEQKTQYSVEHSYQDVVDEAEMRLIELLFGDMFANSNLDLWNSVAKQHFQNEAYDLEFNINNKEKSTDDKDVFRKVRSLSLGQKVVAMLSFILSYSQYSGDFGPLIIDQPEDNLDNQYVFKNLVKDLRDIKDTRQVIIATHSSTIVTNAKAELVIVMESDNKHAWIGAKGFPSEKVIVQHILNYLEGGKESFKHKALLYNDVL